MINGKENNYPFKKFTEKLTQEGMKRNFSKKETREGLESGLQPTDAGFAQWLRNIKNVDAEGFLEHGDEQELKKKYKEFLERINTEINEIFSVPKQQFLARMIKPEEIIEGKLEIRNEIECPYHSHYQLCEECGQSCTGKNDKLSPIPYDGCHSCNSKHFQEKFGDGDSNNSAINELIQKSQLEATNYRQVLEGIPYEKFTNVKYLAKGGFGTVFEAEGNDRYIIGGDKENKKGKRQDSDFDSKMVALKVLNNSEKVTFDFLGEVICYKFFDGVDDNIARCYGLSGEPQTGNYIMVMKHYRNNLKQHLDEEKNDKLYHLNYNLNSLTHIVSGLCLIHGKGLMHCDLHPGNILSSSYGDIGLYITDLGLCRPVNKEKDKNKVYGVLPYVAPEVLRGQPYTQAADIYSFGIIAGEILSGKSPYHEYAYEEFLAVKICHGLRPNIKELRIPLILRDLIERCGDAENSNRPNIYSLFENLREGWTLSNEENYKKIPENYREKFKFYRQYKKLEEEEFDDFKSGMKFSGSREQNLESGDSVLSQIEKRGILGGRKQLRYDFGSNDYWQVIKQGGNEKSKKNLPLSSKTHPGAIYTSRPLDFKNLPQPQNSEEVNEIFYKLSDELEELRISDVVKFSEELKKRTQEKENQVESSSGQNLSFNFTPELIQSGTNCGFNYRQTQDGINIGFQSVDSNFCAGLRDELHLEPLEVLNNLNVENNYQEVDLKEQFQEYQSQIQQPPK